MMAFCNRVHAHPETWFRLPETTMGLLPGVDGTVSIPARIGRHRTLEWLLQDTRVNADTALQWGLIDLIGELDETLLRSRAWSRWYSASFSVG